MYSLIFLFLQETLKNLRKVDDNIVHALNTTIPTTSFSEKGIDPSAQCQDLFKQVSNMFNSEPIINLKLYFLIAQHCSSKSRKCHKKVHCVSL